MLNRGEIIEIIEEKLEKLHAVRTWEATHHAKAQALQEVLDEIKKREAE